MHINCHEATLTQLESLQDTTHDTIRALISMDFTFAFFKFVLDVLKFE